MNRSDKLYVWAGLFLLLATGFIQSGSYLTVTILGLIGLGFAVWAARRGADHG